MDVSRGFHLYMDGNAWCAVGPHHVDLQRSYAGFGGTQQAAIDDLWRQIKDTAPCRSSGKPTIDAFTVHH